MFSVGHSTIIVLLVSMLDAYFRYGFISTDISVVPDTLLDLILNLNSCYSRWTPGTCINKNVLPSFESFHSFVNFLLVLKVIVILKRQFPLQSSNFHAL